MKHLIGMKALSREQIEALLDRAEAWANRPGEQSDALAGRFVANLFFEPSTRTRFSFEVAEKRLGMHVLNVAAEHSSTTKGETLYDTLRTLQAMGVEAAVVRIRENGLLEELADRVGLHLVNAGDGTNEHPTQCLLDLLTMRRHFGRIAGLKVAIIGDLRHSRVLGSHLHALPKLGAELILSGPPNMLRREEELPAGVRTVPLDDAIAAADVVMMLRVQLERHADALFDSPAAYHKAYGLTLERYKRMKPHAVIMHPGPFNRGVEIDTDLVEADRSLIFTQKANGVPVRMAVLENLLTGGEQSWASSLQTANC
ncbi:aspartate carbamoyltransferase catalytic subunit [Brevibacillus sp. SYP-B805]|uniref:aspartate carbamoyltransferase catalytic subunit n=1 Tax=Brevibacillus sp. SYP-B805 TaxID=1578199 RepID=UPI0013EB6E62|nr:aspartate carbamoyltransferase catalytic subunit [Brevibacillus sp. SYP-B805]NGQ93767.1 aspartate carbamoyltransferase catalytic subunit [Brevibacillus sp. SYP-B805]